VGAEQPRVQPDASDPLGHKTGILAGRHVAVGTAAAREQELPGPFVGGPLIIIDRLTGLLAHMLLGSVTEGEEHVPLGRLWNQVGFRAKADFECGGAATATIGAFGIRLRQLIGYDRLRSQPA
jgi:hypothetical protein